jgi:predicted transcriptional regulator
LGRNELPRSVRNLIEQHVNSAADIDTLLLLYRQDGPWTASSVARELRIDEDQAAGILAHLRRRGLLRAEGDSYRFHPRDAPIAEAVADLNGVYPAYRVAIVALIYARPTGPIRDFSNAFRLRNED